jgi:hypothetical protein
MVFLKKDNRLWIYFTTFFQREIYLFFNKTEQFYLAAISLFYILLQENRLLNQIQIQNENLIENTFLGKMPNSLLEKVLPRILFVGIRIEEKRYIPKPSFSLILFAKPKTTESPIRSFGISVWLSKYCALANSSLLLFWAAFTKPERRLNINFSMKNHLICYGTKDE